MRRLPLATIAVLAAVATACSSGGTASWTYAPAASATPAASGSPGASAEPSGSPAGSVAPSGTPAASPAESGQPSTTVVTVTAPTGSATTGFEQTELTGPANTPFSLVFDNQDATAPHNVVINDPAGQPVSIGDTTPFTGPEERTYEVPALAPGVYGFLCQVHPTTMTGTLTIE